MRRWANVVVEPRAPESSTGTCLYSLATKSLALFSSLPYLCSAQPQAARKFQRAPPEVFGFGVTTITPGLTRSSQSLMPFGLPLRTTNTIVDVYGDELLGSR